MLTLTPIHQAHRLLKMLTECHQLIFRESFHSTSILNVLTYQKTFAISASDLLKTKKSILFKKTKCLYLSQKTVNLTALILLINKSKTISNLPRKRTNIGSRLTSIALMQTNSNLQEQLKETECHQNLLTNFSKNSFQKLLVWILQKLISSSPLKDKEKLTSKHLESFLN